MDYYRGAFGGNIAFEHLKKHASFTVLLMIVNLSVFIISSVIGLHEWSIIAGGMLPLRFITYSSEYWRILTSIFIHGNLMHVGFNMIILMHAGGYLEPLMGTKVFALFYLLSGLMVSVFTGLFSTGLSVGASGAIFAVLGFILYYDLRAKKMGIETHSSIVPLVFANLIFTFLAPNVSTVAHLSGLAIGFFYAKFNK